MIDLLKIIVGSYFLFGMATSGAIGMYLVLVALETIWKEIRKKKVNLTPKEKKMWDEIMKHRMMEDMMDRQPSRDLIEKVGKRMGRKKPKTISYYWEKKQFYIL